MEVLSGLTSAHIHVATAIAAYFISLAFYRLFLHPLAGFPGPRLAAVTRYYEGYFDVICGGQYTFQIAKLHKLYGPIIRISPHELHVTDPAFFEKLYSHDGRWNKYDWSYDAFGSKMSTVCSIDHDVHRRRRAPLNAFFSKASISRRQDLIQNLAVKLCDRIDQFCGSTKIINLSHAISAFTRDAAAEYIISKSYNNLDVEDFNAGMTDVFQSGGAVWRVTKHVRWFGPLMKSLPLSLVEKMGDEGTKVFFAFLKDMLQFSTDVVEATVNGVADDRAPRTIIHELLDSDLPPEEKTAVRINDDVGTITGAAFETSANTLRLILYYIYTDADILSRLRTEITMSKRSIGATKTTDMSLSALEQLPYLTAVLMEGLRLSPGIASRMARIAPDRSIAYAQWEIPQGTPVGMTTYLMHMDETLYPEPKRFEPNRWMDMDVRRKASKTYAPFARGTRICLGMHLAWAELYIVIAAVVDQFDFQFENAGLKDVECVSDQFIVGVKDLSGIKARVAKHNGLV